MRALFFLKKPTGEDKRPPRRAPTRRLDQLTRVYSSSTLWWNWWGGNEVGEFAREAGTLAMEGWYVQTVSLVPGWFPGLLDLVVVYHREAETTVVYPQTRSSGV